MKAGKILGEIVGGAAAIAAIGGLAYTFVAVPVSEAIQDNFFHDFRGRLQVRGMELYYKDVEPYSPFLPFPGQDKNGHAEIRLRGNELVFLRYEDLTVLTLEGRIMVTNSKGEEAKFDKKNKYGRKTLEDASELKEALESFGSDESIKDIIEQEIKEAIKKR